MPPEDAGTLLDGQRALAAMLHERTDTAGRERPLPFVAHAPPAVEARLDAYRNNARQFFRAALALTYPVLRLRVGDDFFRQLAHEYRARHPSRSGDLHWVGARFPAWLDTRLAGTDYAWLADLARLEWACEEAAAERAAPGLALAALATVAPDALGDTTLGFQPSMRLIESRWPVWSVWQANQGDEAGRGVDFDAGGECCVCACISERVVAYRLEPDDFRLLGHLHRGTPFGEALELSATTPVVLQRVLGWAFGEGLVATINPSARA
jgi:hypothetical protein